MRSRRGLPPRDARRGPTDRTVDDPGRAQLPGQDPPGRRLGSSQPRRAARCGREGAVVRVVGHVAGRITVDAELLSATDLRLGNAARLYCADDHRWFHEIYSRLDVSGADTAVQWNTLAKITAITGAAPRAVRDDEFARARSAMTDVYAGRDKPSSGRTMAPCSTGCS
jgi:hypothetical protein